VTRVGARSEAGLAFAGSEPGVLGSRRVDGPTAEVGGKRAGAKESTSFKTPRYRGKAKVDLQSLVLRTLPRPDSEWHLRVGRNGRSEEESKGSEPSIFANSKEEVDFSRGKSGWVCVNSWL
jgi:hypothetical protein